MKKRNFSAELNANPLNWLLTRIDTVADAAKAMDVGLSTMTRWVKNNSRDERQAKHQSLPDYPGTN